MERCFSTVACIILMMNIACLDKKPNQTAAGQDELKSLELENPINIRDITYNDTLYVPIYSDIYVDASNQNSLLAATLSIRNTSYQDSLYVSKIDYFDTDGNLVKNFLVNPISLHPMATVNYVIERENEVGGAGANFIVVLSAKQPNIRPLVQAVMIGQSGNKGFSFSTDGYSIKNK